jgi:hypothetical protein
MTEIYSERLAVTAEQLLKEVEELGIPLASECSKVVQMIELDGDLYELIVAIKPIANMEKYLGDD